MHTAICTAFPECPPELLPHGSFAVEDLEDTKAVGAREELDMATDQEMEFEVDAIVAALDPPKIVTLSIAVLPAWHQTRVAMTQETLTRGLRSAVMVRSAND